MEALLNNQKILLAQSLLTIQLSLSNAVDRQMYMQSIVYFID